MDSSSICRTNKKEKDYILPLCFVWPEFPQEQKPKKSKKYKKISIWTAAYVLAYDTVQEYVCSNCFCAFLVGIKVTLLVSFVSKRPNMMKALKNGPAIHQNLESPQERAVDPH